MATSVVFNGVTYSIPAAGEVGWASLSNFLIAVANNSGTTGKQIQTIRTALTTPVAVATTDYGIVTNLTTPGAVSVVLPSGVNGQLFAIYDGKGDAETNNVTITGTAQNIRGAASLVISANYGAVLLQFSTTENQWEVLSEINVVPVARGGTGAIDAAGARTNIGLGNVDNTSDATKNAAVATLTNKTLTAPVINSPTGLVKADVGLGNVDNTSDATKDAAVATLTNKTLTAPVINSPTGIVKADVGLGNVSNDAQLKIASNLSDLANASTARSNLGLGTMATQDANNVTITGGAISGVTGIITDALDQYSVGVGNSSNIRTPVNTNLLGDVLSWVGTSTFTSSAVNTGSDTIDFGSALPFGNGDSVYFTNSGGALPTGLSALTRYFVRDTSGTTYKVSATVGGTVVDLTAGGSGTNTVYYGAHAIKNTHYGMLRLDGIAGYGSTNNKIRRFSNTTETIGDGVFFTSASTAANGLSITMNVKGMVSFTFTDSFNVASTMGLSRNSNQLTTQVDTITAAHRLCAARAENAVPGTVSWTGIGNSGDVFRPHCNGDPAGTIATAGGITFTFLYPIV